jgi:hypothetical protein
MSKYPSGEYTTVTVLGSWPVATADGSTALVLRIAEGGPIAFAVDKQAIAAIRSALNDLEALQQHIPGSS